MVVVCRLVLIMPERGQAAAHSGVIGCTIFGIAGGGVGSCIYDRCFSKKKKNRAAQTTRNTADNTEDIFVNPATLSSLGEEKKV